jgi:poly-gamma-glutamate capsule biosynthesis protein CapA/YwtB (metallophosphatase superfamily)
LPSTIDDDFTFAAVGDTLQVRAQLPTDDKGFLAVAEVVQAADVAFANGEITCFDVTTFDGWPAAQTGGGFTLGSPDVPADLKAQGFSLIARANNHAADWGIAGMRETDRLFAQQGLVIAGTGESRAQARAPRYHQSRKGRVGLVASTTTFTLQSEAGAPLGQARARPGVAALRVKPSVHVGQEVIDALRQDYGEQTSPAVVTWTTDRASAPSGKGDELNIFGVNFKASGTPGVSYEMNPVDLAETMASIRQARAASDFVAYSVHAHESATGRFNDHEQPDFMPVLAHAAIDAGADIFLGHGPHVLRGIEIYRGKPIFYGLGNYFFQLDLLEGLPRDILNPAYLSEHEQVAPLLAKGFGDTATWESVVAVSRFAGGVVRRIELHPIDLGADLPSSRRGVPRRASRAKASAIIRRIAALSERYGTAIAESDGIGVISVAP